MIPRSLQPGQQLTAAELNSLTMAAYQGAMASGSGDMAVSQTGGGLTIRDLSQDRFFARITGAPTGAKYPFVEVVRNGDGTYTDITEWPGRAGTATSAPAVELSGSTSVPVDAIVQLTALTGGGGWGFGAGAAGAALNTQNVDGTDLNAATDDIRANQATFIEFTTVGGGDPHQRLDINTTGLCASQAFVDCVQSNMVFNVTVDVPGCLSIILTKTNATALLSGQTVLHDVTAALAWKTRTITLPAGTTVGAEGYCVAPADCCPAGPRVLVDTDCCPDDEVPADLTLTVSGTGGGSFGFDYLVDQWETGVVSLTGAGAGTIDITMYCFGGVWQFNTNGTPDYTVTFSNYVTTCNPFSVRADGLLDGAGSYDGETRVFTATP